MKAVLGIDPGVRGGISVIGPSGSSVFVQGFRPNVPADEFSKIVDGALKALWGLGGSDCFMEKVHSMPRDGHVGAFTFGRINGLPEGCLGARGVRPWRVYPMMWQAKMGCLSCGNKNITKRKAQKLFPTKKITHSIADSLLIAEYGRRVLASF